MTREYTPHEWADHYNARASQSERDADAHRHAADQAAAEGRTARAAYLHAEAAAHQTIADKYRESARKSARMAERLDDQRRAYGRAQRGELHP
jgi:hypothetical protein